MRGMSFSVVAGREREGFICGVRAAMAFLTLVGEVVEGMTVVEDVDKDW